MRKMKTKKIALLLSATMLCGAMPVMAARYYDEDVYAEVTKEVKVVAGKGAGKTARVEIEILDNDALQGQTLELTLGCGSVTTASAVYVNSDNSPSVSLPITMEEDKAYFEITVPKETKRKDVIEIDFEGLSHPLDASCDEIAVTISSKNFLEEDMHLADVIQPVSVVASKVTLKPALKDQVGGKITITEELNGAIEQGKITLTISDDYVKFSGTPKITATNGIKVSDKVNISKDGTKMELNVIRGSSKYTGEIVIEDMVFTTTGATPDGNWYLDVSGSSLCEDANEAYWFKDFITVTDKEPVVDPNFALITFMVDSPYYMVDKEMVRMDAAPYIENGRTMIPVRYVAQALWISESSIQYANGIISIFYKGNLIHMKVGETKVKWNSVPILILDTPVALVDGRAYVPVAQLKDIFAVDVKWDPYYRTVTFKSDFK